MASLTGNQINQSYQGLIKTIDNGAVDPTVLKQLSDGLGGSLPIEFSQVQTNFLGLVDFSSATVSGLPGGAAGLINGTGSNSLVSAPSLTTIAATAGFSDSFAIGNNAKSNAAGSMAFGSGAQNTGSQTWASIALGQNCTNGNNGAIAMGGGAKTTGTGAQAIGDTTRAYGPGNLSFGQNCQSTGGDGNVLIGRFISLSSGQGNTVIGGSNVTMPAGQNDNVLIGRTNSVGANTSNSIAIGLVATMGSGANDTVIIGRGSSAGAGAQDSVAIGRDASVTANQAVALGYQTVASRSMFVSVNELETTVVGGGIIMYSPDGTAYKLTIANGGTVSVAAV